MLLQPHSLDTYVSDLMVHSPVRYWFEYIVSCAIGWIFLFVSVNFGVVTFVGVLALIVSSLSFFRCITYIHEIVHFFYRKDVLPGFPLFWNLTCGVFFMVPYFMYKSHKDHHKIDTYGTKNDPRFLPVAVMTKIPNMLPILSFFYVPLLALFRFMIISPVSWLIGGKFRRYVITHMSSITLNNAYERSTKPEDLKGIVGQEILVFTVWTLIAIGVYIKLIPLLLLFAFYLLCSLELLYGHFNNLVAHRYTDSSYEDMDFNGQIIDAVTFEGPSLFGFFFTPISQQYHGTHHLFPEMPYHSLKKAHYRIKSLLPQTHPYHKSVAKSPFSVITDLWKGVNRKSM